MGIRLQTSQADQIKRDLTVSSFVFTVVLVGVLLAAHTDRPVFWLLIGPAPLGVLHTIRTFLQQRVNRQKGLLALRTVDDTSKLY